MILQGRPFTPSQSAPTVLVLKTWVCDPEKISGRPYKLEEWVHQTNFGFFEQNFELCPSVRRAMLAPLSRLICHVIAPLVPAEGCPAFLCYLLLLVLLLASNYCTTLG